MKIFWGSLILISLLVTGGAGYYVFTKMEMNAAPPAPVRPPAPPRPPTPPIQQTEPEPAPVTIAPATRNILFRFPKPSAKSVFIVGDFNEWKQQALTKKEKGWEITVALVPGSYKYMYVVDERQVRDPNNKTVLDGKSVINVKPLTSQK